MRREQDRSLIRRLLDLCSEVEELDELLRAESTPAGRRRLRSRRKESLRTMRNLLAGVTSRSLPPWLREARKRHHLEDGELLVLLFLLHRRISSSNPSMKGRELLRLLYENSSDLLRAGALLEAESRLVASGLVDARIASPETTLEGQFRLAERIWRQAFRSFHSQPRRGRSRAPELTGYLTGLEHVMDLRRLLVLYEKRASLLFPHSHWAEVHPDVTEQVGDLGELIEADRKAVAAREARTGRAVELPVLEVRREHHLEPAEEIIILALLFQELFSATPILQAAELLRLVAPSEEELLRQRHLLAPGGNLLTSGLLALEIETDEKPLLAGVYLPQWVVERLLANAREGSAFRPEDQRRFQRYLEDLESSEDFYRHL